MADAKTAKTNKYVEANIGEYWVATISVNECELKLKFSQVPDQGVTEGW
jgi:hypothetical protein